jgi:hypothetical protein
VRVSHVRDSLSRLDLKPCAEDEADFTKLLAAVSYVAVIIVK